MYMINKRLIDVLGTDLCERLIKYCKEKDIDEYVFMRGAVANVMGLEHVPQHYKPIESTDTWPESDDAIESSEPDTTEDEIMGGGDENV